MRGMLLRGLLFRQAFSCEGILVCAFGGTVKPRYLFDGERFQAPFLPSCLSSPKNHALSQRLAVRSNRNYVAQFIAVCRRWHWLSLIGVPVAGVHKTVVF